MESMNSEGQLYFESKTVISRLMLTNYKSPYFDSNLLGGMVRKSGECHNHRTPLHRIVSFLRTLHISFNSLIDKWEN